MEPGYWLIRIYPECLGMICDITGVTPINIVIRSHIWITIPMKCISHSRLEALRASKTIRGFTMLEPPYDFEFFPSECIYLRHHLRGRGPSAHPYLRHPPCHIYGGR
jgi:hypothetical protein